MFHAPTTVMRLCDDDGIVRSGALHDGTDYPCTGHAHYDGVHVECTHPPARCTCPIVWHAIVPPPRCPVHGQAQMPIVSC